jgi:phage shock protein E
MSFFGNLFGGGQSSEQLATLIKEGAFLVDVRSPGEFAGGSAKGAVKHSFGQYYAANQKI